MESASNQYKSLHVRTVLVVGDMGNFVSMEVLPVALLMNDVCAKEKFLIVKVIVNKNIIKKIKFAFLLNVLFIYKKN
jgi:hypothetical protein